ncbi:MAG: YhgE/Pip domain-containing protein, partial [[Eubacterium] rectale]|nr:YhgE/Pip domain-containing protein [Agathobacter rectalis]
MKNIFKIFGKDIMGLVKNILAMVIAVGLCFLPALYAWFNIYANWDPYGNTGNVNIAVANLDEGWKDESGEELNMGDGIVESLKAKDTIGWKFVDTKEEALDGVRSGNYYAALVIDEKFTYGMYNGVAENISNPKITYYVNDKKNAVATKITDSAATTVKSSINKEFLQVLAEKVFEETNEFSSEMSQKDTVNKFVSKLEDVSASLNQYEQLIDTFIDGNASLAKVSAETGNALNDGQDKISDGQDKLQQSRDDLSSTQGSFNEFSTDISDTMSSVQLALSNISSQLDSADLDTDAAVLQSDIKEISASATALHDSIDSLAGKMKDVAADKIDAQTPSADLVDNNLQIMLDRSQSIIDNLSAASASDATAQTTEALLGVISKLSTTVQSINDTYQNQVVPQINDMISSMSDTLDSVDSMLTNLSSTAGTMSEVFTGVGDTIDVLNTSMTQLKGVITAADDKIQDTLTKLKEASEDEKMDIIINLLSGDPEKLSTFFAEPVQVSDHYIYEIANYGSGVAPFYTTLAIKVMQTRKLSLMDFLSGYTKSFLSFNEFILREALSLVDPVSGHLLRFLTIMRHPVNVKLLKTLNLYNAERIAYFVDNMILTR